MQLTINIKRPSLKRIKSIKTLAKKTITKAKQLTPITITVTK
tara:strand:- start:618 stop:743 length:126 start_codon:yes stop_codon:yes gene_type:complete